MRPRSNRSRAVAIRHGLGMLFLMAVVTGSIFGFGIDRGTQNAFAEPPKIGGCQIFPTDNAWNKDISKAPVDSNSDRYIARINSRGKSHLHPDFSSNPDYGIPYTVVEENQLKMPINFIWWPEQSDPGPYPIPLNAPIEASTDNHVLAVHKGDCKLYELYEAQPNGNGGWDAASGAVWDLNSNKLRTEGWTSADAAGLPILPGLVRYEEIQNGEINHALRFTVKVTQNKYIHPATHNTNLSTNPNDPPMGLRLRLKASYDISGFSKENQVILRALKRYGMIVADNGSDWYISGTSSPNFVDEDLYKLHNVPGSAFEVVDGAYSPQEDSNTPFSPTSTTLSISPPLTSKDSSRKLKIVGRKVTISRKGRGSIKVLCPKTTSGKCEGKLKLIVKSGKKTTKVATKPFATKAGRQAKIAIKIAKRPLKILNRKKRLKVVAVAQSRNAATVASSAKTSITLLSVKK